MTSERGFLGVVPVGFRRNGLPIWPIRGGDGTDDPPTPPSDEPVVEPTELDTSQVPAAIRNSPEFRELVKQNRSLSRAVGTAARREATVRGELETVRQAAEAERAAQLEQRVQGILGSDGVAAWDEIAELSATDPVAAAVRISELIAAKGQTPAEVIPPTGQPPATPAAGSAAVPAQTPPPPSGRVDGSAPIGVASIGEDIDAVIAQAEADYQAVVKRNTDPVSMNRVTMRERGKGFMSFLAGSYLKAGATPKPKPEPRA